MSNSNSITTAAKTQAKDTVDKYVRAIQSATALDENQAKTVLYYAIATHAIKQLEVMPILVLRGVPSSGKSTLIGILRQITYSPININGKDSKAALRDSLKQNTTALIEEADTVDEDTLIDRYSKDTSGRTVKRGGAGKGWRDTSLNLFGATVLHRRVPFNDSALESRSIEIMTSRKQGFAGKSFPRELDGKPLKEIADHIEWKKDIANFAGGRIRDTWSPLLAVAVACEDEKWADYVIARMDKGEESLKAGHDVEPSQRVFQALLALASKEGDAPEPDTRVALKDITSRVNDDSPELSSQQVGKLIRELGFAVTRMGGTMRVYVESKAELSEVAQKLGIEDEWLAG